MKLKIAFLIILVLIENRYCVFAQDISVRDMSIANTIIVANGVPNIVKVIMSSDKNSWQTVVLNPYEKKIYRLSNLFVNIKTNGIPDKYILKKSNDSLYVVYWDANFSKYRIARRKI